MRHSPFRLAVALLPLAVAACSWVNITPEGREVSVGSAEQVASCQRVGKVTSRVTSQVAYVDRSVTAVQEELATLARNSGAEMGGDTVAPETVVKDGVQTFGVYRCGRR